MKFQNKNDASQPIPTPTPAHADKAKPASGDTGRTAGTGGKSVKAKAEKPAKQANRQTTFGGPHSRVADAPRSRS